MEPALFEAFDFLLRCNAKSRAEFLAFMHELRLKEVPVSARWYTPEQEVRFILNGIANNMFFSLDARMYARRYRAGIDAVEKVPVLEQALRTERQLRGKGVHPLKKEAYEKGDLHSASPHINKQKYWQGVANEFFGEGWGRVFLVDPGDYLRRGAFFSEEQIQSLPKRERKQWAAVIRRRGGGTGGRRTIRFIPIAWLHEEDRKQGFVRPKKVQKEGIRELEELCR